MKSGAIFSDCGFYRTQLWRIWDVSLPLLMMLMLNPSKAGTVANDPTVQRQIERARLLGLGGLLVGNIFAYVSTDPRGMKSAYDPIGEGNDEAILSMAKRAGLIICAWGAHGKHRDREYHVLEMLSRFPLYALRVTKQGHPEHPLYLPYEIEPIPFNATARNLSPVCHLKRDTQSGQTVLFEAHQGKY